MAVIIMRTIAVLVVIMLMILVGTLFGIMTIIVMMFRGLVWPVFGLGVVIAVLRVRVVSQRNGLGRVGLGMFDDLTLDAVAAAAAAGAAMARTAAAVTIFVFFLCLAVGAFVRLDQGLTVGDRNLVVVGMNFAEGEEAVAVAAILDKGRLQRRLYPRDLGEINIAAQLLALGGFKIKFFDAIAADHDDPGLFRVGGIDQHLVGHFGTLGGGGRVGP
jgi:hypothetical protein